MSRETISGGGDGPADTKIERQAWHLRQTGERVEGFYMVEQTLLAGDERPFPCSGDPKATTLLRIDVRGYARRDGVELDESDELLAKGPCSPVYHGPGRLTAKLSGGALVLAGEGGAAKIQLYRQQPGSDASRELRAFAQPDVEFAPVASFPSLGPGRSAAPADVRGTWRWEGVTTAAGGDRRYEREEWLLDQRGDAITGHYDRFVRQVSTDGNPYRCNGKTEVRVATRYQVTGTLRGGRIALHERGFRVLEGSPCDPGERRLDAYDGEATSGELRLSWGTGRQTLRRP